MNQKDINSKKILLCQKSTYWKGAFLGALLGNIGLLLCLGRYIILGKKHFVMEDWLTFASSAFLFSLFLPLSAALFISNRLYKKISELEKRLIILEEIDKKDK